MILMLQTLCLCVNQMYVVVCLGNALHLGSKCGLSEFTELNLLSVGSHCDPRDIRYID